MTEVFPQASKKSVPNAAPRNEAAEKDPLATGLAPWDLVPPATVVRRAMKKKRGQM